MPIFGKAPEEENIKASAEKTKGADPDDAQIKAWEDEGVNPDQEKTEDSAALKVANDRSKDLTDQIMRLQAEFSNFRKRTEKEKGEAIRFGKEATLERLIGLADVMDSALMHSQKATEVESMKKGFEMVIQEFIRFLKSEGAQVIQSKGEKFDPHMHEAVEQVETENEGENDTILEELQKGYLINGRLLRPARVKVAKFISKDNPEKEK